jgi:hypothetical protein
MGSLTTLRTVLTLFVGAVALMLVAAVTSAQHLDDLELIKSDDPIVGLWSGLGLGISDYLPNGENALGSPSSGRTTAEFLCVIDAKGGLGSGPQYRNASGRCIGVRRSYDDAGCLDRAEEFPVWLYRVTGQIYVRGAYPASSALVERWTLSSDNQAMIAAVLVAPGFDSSLEYTQGYRLGPGYDLAKHEAFINSIPRCD